MGHRELCPCCLKYVTQGQLKKHAHETARRQSILAMGGDPTIPDIPLRTKPITGNDIFKPQAPTPAPTPVPSVHDEAAHPGIPIHSPVPISSLPHSVPPHSIKDDDFPTDTPESDATRHPPVSPQSFEFPDYPSVETPDTDENASDEQDQDEINLDEFMDLEFLKQSECCPLYESITLTLDIIRGSRQPYKI